MEIMFSCNCARHFWERKSASLKKIHTAHWIIKDQNHLAAYLMWAGKSDRKRADVRLEPAIDRVINLLVTNGVAIKKESKISLSELGVEIFNKIDEEIVFAHNHVNF